MTKTSQVHFIFVLMHNLFHSYFRMSSCSPIGGLYRQQRVEFFKASMTSDSSDKKTCTSRRPTFESDSEEGSLGVQGAARCGMIQTLPHKDPERLLLHVNVLLHILRFMPSFTCQLQGLWQTQNSKDKYITSLALVKTQKEQIQKLIEEGYPQVKYEDSNFEKILQEAGAQRREGLQLNDEIMTGQWDGSGEKMSAQYPFIWIKGNFMVDSVHLSSHPAAKWREELSNYRLQKIGPILDVKVDLSKAEAKTKLEEILYFYDENLAYNIKSQSKDKYLCLEIKASSTLKAIKLHYSFQQRGIKTQFADQPVTTKAWSKLPSQADIEDTKGPQSSCQSIRFYIDSMTKKFRKNDFTYLLRQLNTDNSKMQAVLNHITDNFDIYGPFCTKSLQNLQDILKFKIETMPDPNYIFPRYTALKKKIERCTDYIGQRKNIQDKDRNTDVLYHHFVKEMMNRMGCLRRHVLNRGNSSLPIADFIGGESDFGQVSGEDVRWRQIYAQTVERMFQTSKVADELMVAERKKQLEFANNMHRERVNPLSCISCCQFFYSDTNIKDEYISRTPIHLMGLTTDVKTMEPQIKDLICYLLNNKGGVILFDCVRRFRDIVPIGEYMSQKMQEEWVSRIKAYCESIVPAQLPQHNIEVTFVPIVKSPADPQAKIKGTVTSRLVGTEEHRWIDRQYLEGVYVTRIKVNPINGWQTHYWLTQDKVAIFPDKLVNQRCKRMNPRKVSRLIKSKFNKQYVSINSSDRELELFLKPAFSCFHEGQCTQPDKGVPAPQNMNEAPQFPDNVESIYPYASLVLVRASQHATVRSRLWRNSVQCQIEPVYQHRPDLQGTRQSAILYHKLRFDRLLNLVTYNPQFQFGGRGINVVIITEFLKLSGYSGMRPPKQIQFERWKEHFLREHRGAYIELISFDNDKNQQEFYLRTKTKEGKYPFIKGQVFMQYVLKNQERRVLFKNPKNYNTFTPRDKKERLIPMFDSGTMYYSRTNRS